MIRYLKELLVESKDGEWGEGEPSDDASEAIVIRGTDFESVRLGDLSNVPRRFIKNRFLAKKSLQPFDLIIETAGGSKDRPTGRTVFMRPTLFSHGASSLPITCASFARFLRIDKSKADPNFLYWKLQLLYNNRALLKYNTQHTGVARFQYTTFAEIEQLHLPPLEVQRRSASILSAYEELIENNNRRIKVLEEMVRALYREWFINFRFPAYSKANFSDSPHGRIPSVWSWRTLAEIASVNECSINRKSEPEQINYVDISSVSSGRIEKSEPYLYVNAPGRARRIVRDGDTIWSMVRPNLRAFAMIVNPMENLIVSTGFAVITPKQVPPSFIYLATTTEEFIKYLVNRARGAAYPAVNASDFNEARLLVPEPACLSRFEQVAAPAFEMIDRLQRKIANLRQTCVLLLPKLMSGEIDVSSLPDPIT